MRTNSTYGNSRIEIVDALRGFALLGLFLVHSVTYFDLSVREYYSPPWLEAIDRKVYFIIQMLFHGKAYAIFSFMFGLSFFIQMDRQASKGIDFRKRFAWRLIILLMIGYLHSLIYLGDILTIYAVIGIGLIFINKLPDKILIGVSVLMLLQIPMLVELFRILFITGYQLPISELIQLNNQANEIYTDNSIYNLINFNSSPGQKAKWIFIYISGRLYQIIGLFILGIILGRKRFFANYKEKTSTINKTLFLSLICFILFYFARKSLQNLELSDDLYWITNRIILSYENLTLAISLVTLFIILFQWQISGTILSKLIPLGKMSLTTYITQNIFGVIIFYEFGFAMYRYWGPTMCFIFALIFFTAQQMLAHWWLKNFHYGPLEWVWRCATFTNFRIPLRKK